MTGGHCGDHIGSDRQPADLSHTHTAQPGVHPLRPNGRTIRGLRPPSMRLGASAAAGGLSDSSRVGRLGHRLGSNLEGEPPQGMAQLTLS